MLTSMFLTDRFAFLHIPKTGGTFVHFHLRRIYARTLFRKLIHSLRSKCGICVPFMQYSYAELPKHTIRRTVACLRKDLPIVLCIRNPFDVYVSQFRFRWWEQFPDRWFTHLERVRAEFGELSKFSFETFVEATLRYSHWTETVKSSRRCIGPLSAEWLRYFVREPNDCLRCTSDEDLLRQVQEELKSVTILRTENLQVDLCNFLGSVGVDSQSLEAIRTANRIFPGLPTRVPNDSFHDYFSDDLAKKVSETEWPIFNLFLEYPAQIDRRGKKADEGDIFG